MKFEFNEKLKKKLVVGLFIVSLFCAVIGTVVLVTAIKINYSDNIFGGAVLLFLFLSCFVFAVYFTFFNRNASLEIIDDRIVGKFGLNKKIDKRLDEIKDVYCGTANLIFLFKDNTVVNVSFLYDMYNAIKEIKKRIFAVKAEKNEKPDAPNKAEALFKTALKKWKVWLVFMVATLSLLLLNFLITLILTNFKEFIEFTERDMLIFRIFAVTESLLFILFIVFSGKLIKIFPF